jgi:hypothetical protein
LSLNAVPSTDRLARMPLSASACPRALSRHRGTLVDRVPVMLLRTGVRALPVRHRGPHPDAAVKLGLGRSGEIVFI